MFARGILLCGLTLLALAGCKKREECKPLDGLFAFCAGMERSADGSEVLVDDEDQAPAHSAIDETFDKGHEDLVDGSIGMAAPEACEEADFAALTTATVCPCSTGKPCTCKPENCECPGCPHKAARRSAAKPVIQTAPQKPAVKAPTTSPKPVAKAAPRAAASKRGCSSCPGSVCQPTFRRRRFFR